MMNIVMRDETEVGARIMGLTSGFFCQFTTKNISVVKNIYSALPQPRDTPGEHGMA
jgi:hypothetical protein